jgi:hypothetical protein
MAVSAHTSLFDVIAAEAAAESPLWAEALLPCDQRELVPIFAPLAQERFHLGVETIYEGYLLHYGRPRLFAPVDEDTGLLLGDYLYAHGLVRVAATGSVEAVCDLAELISLCAQARAAGGPGEAEAWAATAVCLGAGCLGEARAALRDDGDASLLDIAARAGAGCEAVERAAAAHDARVG